MKGSLQSMKHCIVLLLIGLTLFKVAKGSIIGDISPNEGFDGLKAYRDLLFMGSQHRVVGRPFYVKVTDYLVSEAENAAKNSKKRIEVKKYHGGMPSNETSIGYHFQDEITNVLVRFESEKYDQKPITFSAHYDGHAVGASHYDDAIHCAIMLEMVREHALGKIELPCPVQFLFVGSEEVGLHGSRKAIKDGIDIGTTINLEAMGTGRPLAMLTRSKMSTSVVKAWSKVSGSILATFGNDFMKTGLVKSTSDLRIFELNGVPGAELVYVGNPSHYHTRYDVCMSALDLEMEGNMLLSFIRHFKHYNSEKQTLGFGISPISITMSYGTTKLIAVILLVFTVIDNFGLFRIMKSFIWTFLKLVFICIGICLLFRQMPMKYSSSFELAFSTVWILSWSVIFKFFPPVLRFKPIYKNIQTVIDIILIMMTVNTDGCIIIILGYVLHRVLRQFKVDSTIICYISLIPYMFFIAISGGIFVPLTSQMPGKTASIVFPIMVLAVLLRSYPIIAGCSEIRFRKTSYVFELTFISILLFMIFKKHPYSRHYLLKGSLAHYYYENKTSILAFMPETQDRAIKHLLKILPGYKRHDNFTRGYIHAPAVYKEIPYDKLPDSLPSWPEYRIERSKIDEKHRAVTLTIDELDEKAENTVLIVRCPGYKCVKKIMNESEVVYVKIHHSDYNVAYRVSPSRSGLVFNLELEGNSPISADLIVGSLRHSDEMNDFVKNAPDYVTDFMKIRYYSGTNLLKQISL